jgi:molybdopterin-binding protein
MQLSTSNQLRGTVTRVVRGAVNMEAILARPLGTEVVSIITTRSGEALGLVEGKEAVAVIKASDVMVAVA